MKGVRAGEGSARDGVARDRSRREMTLSRPWGLGSGLCGQVT